MSLKMSRKTVFEKIPVWLVIALQLALLYSFPPALSTAEDSLEAQKKEIAGELVCLCGCGNMIMETCTCGEATENKRYILQQLKAGKPKSEIFQHFIDKYGEQVLAAPKREGFNWVVWVVVPYLVPLGAAIGLAFLISKWAKRRKFQPDQTPIETSASQQIPDKYRQQIEDELKKLE